MTEAELTNLRDLNEAEIESWSNFMDLQVPLAIELGRTNLTARAILELEVQGIIQLQRSTADGVDVVASGMHIARGEIITIEDRTGVRINEIIMNDRAS